MFLKFSFEDVLLKCFDLDNTNLVEFINQNRVCVVTTALHNLGNCSSFQVFLRLNINYDLCFYLLTFSYTFFIYLFLLKLM